MNDDSQSVAGLLPSFIKLGQAMLDQNEGQQGRIAEQYFNERLYAAEYINDEAIPGFSLARCRVKPGITTQLHRLSVDEWYVIESGEGCMELDSIEQQISVGAIVQIPRGVDQRIRNTGTKDLVFFCVCTPRFTPETYSTNE